MAKALFFSTPLTGHINPSLALVRELVRRGDQVIYYSTDEFAAQIEGAGACYRRHRSTLLESLKNLPQHMHDFSSLVMRTTVEILEHELASFRAENPDYIIMDSVAQWGQWTAQIFGIPLVTSVTTFAFNRSVLRSAVAHGVRPRSARLFLSKLRHLGWALLLVRQLRKRYGIAGPRLNRLLFGHSDLNIVYTSRYFQPCAETFGEQFQFVGPAIGPDRFTGGFAWDKLQQQPILYISLGTLFNDNAGFYRTCFAAFENQELQVIMSVGANVSSESLGPVPRNFIVRESVPQVEILRRATAFISHGGMNSVSEGLLHGVPVLAIPQMSEQEIVGRRVEELGAGLYLRMEELSPQKLRDAVQRLRVDPAIRRQAAVVRESLQSAGGAERAAHAIQSFTRNRLTAAQHVT